MTLEQVQEQFDDAMQLTLTHKPGAMHEYRLRKIGEHGLLYMVGKPCEEPNKVLYLKLGKTKSIVIFSREAYIQEHSQKEENICYKTGKPCVYGCKGLCKESC